MFKKFIAIVAFIYNTLSFASPITLHAVEENISVHGKTTKVFNIIQSNHTEGYKGIKDEFFDVILKNDTKEPISVHWHGLILPNDQDGVPYVTQLPIPPGKSHHYLFKIKQAGTFWMHSHYRFHEQELMSAPLTLKDKNDPYAKDQDITIMLQGFTFKKPEKILFDLQHPKPKKMIMSMPTDFRGATRRKEIERTECTKQYLSTRDKLQQSCNLKNEGQSKPDLNDVVFDAYLANRKTLSQPEIVTVRPNDKVRLRLINAATATNFWVFTGQLKGTIIAVDGNDITPIQNSRFQLAIAQRMDIEVTIPKSGGVFPILAQVEGRKDQTGILLVTKNTTIPKFSEQAKTIVPALNDTQELQLHPLHALPIKPVNRVLNYKLTGDMNRYIWKINDEIWPHIKPLKIKKGDRVEMVFINDTGMAHPMHLHGHVFQVSEINGKKLASGPLRDTILVMPYSTKKIIFDADNPGIWMMHCHVLYHMKAGMMTTTNYQDYPEPDYYQKLINF